MGVTATLLGAAWGTTTIMYCNAMRKVAFFKRPWEHVISAGVFAYVFNKIAFAEEWLYQRVTTEAKLQIAKNKDKYEEEYRRLLGPRFEKMFPSETETASE